MNRQLKEHLKQDCFSALLALCLYFALYLPVEFTLTEILFIVPKINPWINTVVLLLAFLLSSTFDISIILKNKLLKKLFLFSFIALFCFYGFYREEKLKREYLPKIYKVVLSGAIQAEMVEIHGVNFGPPFKRGWILVEGMDFQIKEWSENLVIAESAVPSMFDKKPLRLKSADGKISNGYTFEVEDPSKLKN